MVKYNKPVCCYPVLYTYQREADSGLQDEQTILIIHLIILVFQHCLSRSAVMQRIVI